MLGIRYEEHTGFTKKGPFSLSVDIERSKTMLSDSANWHESLEIQLCNEGSGFVIIDGIKYDFSKNDIVIVNTNSIHYTGTEDHMKYSCLIIDSKFCEEADIYPVSFVFNNHLRSDSLLNLIGELKKQSDNTKDVCRVAKMKCTVLKILIEIRQNHTQGIKPDITKDSFDTIKKTIKFIRENYSEKLCLEKISKYVLIDKYTLSREFKKYTEQTVVEYINSYRCQKATELIWDGETISKAAIMCGFNNMSFFTKTFKKHMGKLPSSYKRQKQG